MLTNFLISEISLFELLDFYIYFIYLFFSIPSSLERIRLINFIKISSIYFELYISKISL